MLQGRLGRRGLILFNADGRVVYMSAPAERMSGYSSEEVLGLSVETLIPPRLPAVYEGHRQPVSGTAVRFATPV